MNYLRILASNDLINIAFIAWISAQILKTVFTFVLTKKFVPERLVGAGGMPSSHSALVCSLAVGMAKVAGFTSPTFALTLAFAGIVMYDAMGVRRAAGEHAKMLNRMVFDFKDFSDAVAHIFDTIDVENELDDPSVGIDDIPEKKLKEFLGHTPLEVLGGALLGILVATMYRL